MPSPKWNAEFGAVAISGQKPLPPSKPTVSKDDPRYFDLRYFPTPDPGESWTAARYAQIAAIEAFKKADTSRATIPYQANSPALALEALLVQDNALAVGLRQVFADLLPAKPYCANHLPGRLRILPRTVALRYRHLQFNGPGSRVWMLHDYDRPNATVAHAQAGLPEPNVMVINPENGHGHSAIVLASPVACHCAARVKPLRFYAAVERGIARRLGADRQYTGLIAKNPLHGDWDVEWRRNTPYTLMELAAHLTPADMRPDAAIERTYGAGRNVTVFDELRVIAYREVLAFKRNGETLAAFRARLERVAMGINMQFPEALGLAEIRGIAKSVAIWTWQRFSVETFSAIQRHRINIRWAGHVSNERTQPWKHEGISRATWYRRRVTTRDLAPALRRARLSRKGA
jgi:hypothetical protein